jgi:hypothetical protein
MSLVTPEKIRTLQRKLYRKAKAEPAFRFYVLYDKICREDILRHAYGLARGNAGSPGVDGMSFGQIEAAGGMGNGVMPNGLSYRAHPRLYPSVTAARKRHFPELTADRRYVQLRDDSCP